jgi:hypothetical protein
LRAAADAELAATREAADREIVALLQDHFPQLIEQQGAAVLPRADDSGPEPEAVSGDRDLKKPLLTQIIVGYFSLKQGSEWRDNT